MPISPRTCWPPDRHDDHIMRQSRRPTRVPSQPPTTDPAPRAFDPAELPEIETRLEELGQALDLMGPSTPFGIVAPGFGHRARSLWLGLRHAVAGPSHASVQLILRPLVEMTILLPW